MKVRLLPVLLTIFISAGVLFGGWFAYQSIAVKNPVSHIVDGIQGVEKAQIDTSRDQLSIRLGLSDDVDLATLYRTILDKSSKEVGDREVEIQIEDQASDRLNTIWQSVLFDVAEAMDTHQYGKIPARLSELAKENQGLSVKTGMDDEYVYITLRQDGSAKYVVLPRTSERMGVWPNE